MTESEKEYVTVEGSEKAIDQLRMAFDVVDSTPDEPTETVLKVQSPFRLYEYVGAQSLDVTRVSFDEDWPIEGSVYFHNEGVDAVEAQGDFDFLERGTTPYDGLQSWMRSVEVKIRLFRDGTVDVVEVNPDD